MRPKVKVSYVQVTASQRPPEPLAKFCESVLRQKRLAPTPRRGHGSTHTARENDRAGVVAFVAFVLGRRKVRVCLCICERGAKGEASRGYSLPKGARGWALLESAIDPTLFALGDPPHVSLPST